MFVKVAMTIIFLATYAGVAIGRIPGLRLDRAGIAMAGAAFTLAVGALPAEEAYRAIDLNTLALLVGMMIVVGHLRLSGFFRLAARWALANAHSQPVLLIAIALATGVFSAFLVNDAVCLVMTPLVIELTRALRRNPVPYLIAVAMSSNVGSVATITGNPQNMIIGAISRIPYLDFAAKLTPVAAVGLALTVALVAALSRREMFPVVRLRINAPKVRVQKSQVIKATTVTALVIILFFAGVPVAVAALFGGALLLITREVKPQKVYREIDGALLLMFSGLFVVVAGAERVLLTGDVLSLAKTARLDEVPALTLLVAALSNLISNVPAVLALKPFIPGLGDPTRNWLVVAMASTLAGNFTLVGSVANLIVAEKARAAGIHISFWLYARIGVPLTLASLTFGAFWLAGG